MRARTAAAVLCLAGSLFAADSPFTGTWKLNPEKSKLNPSPGPQTETMVIKADENRQDVKREWTAADGTPIVMSFSAKLDGTSAPVTGAPRVDMISVRKIDDHTVTTTATKDGKLEAQSRVTVSADGKVLTIKASIVDPKGVKHEGIAVYDKQ